MLQLSNALALKEPALQSRWFVYIQDTTDPLLAVAETIEATFTKTESKARFTAGSNNYYPDISDIDGISITFYENKDYDVTKWLERWKKKVYNPTTGFYGVKNEISKRIYLELFSYKTNSPVLEIAYINCWPTDTSPYSLTYEDNVGRIQVQQNFSVDTQELLFIPDNNNNK